MMSLEMIMEQLVGLGDDVHYSECERGIAVMVYDDDDSSIDDEAVDQFLEMLESECISDEEYPYVHDIYHFEGFDVVVEYASYYE